MVISMGVQTPDLAVAMLDALPEGAFLVDGDGRMAAVNAPGAALCGLPAAELLGRPLAELARRCWLPPVLRRALDGGARQSVIQELNGRRLVLTAAPLPGTAPPWVLGLVRDITELERLQREVERLRTTQERYRQELEGLRHTWAEREDFVAVSKPMEQVLELVRRVARVDSTVLLLGESGVGKGVFARTLHRLSGRAARPFVTLDCAAIPESLLESELFGYEAGAFTGARREGKPGIIEQAGGGTLFLDEIAELPLGLQVKLLQLIQERQFTRVGGVRPTAVDVRIIAATHRDLQQMVEQRLFRADLFYRLNVVPVVIPPLRDRPEDIPALIHLFLEQFRVKYNVECQLHPGALEALLAYPWPGNVRELENMVERLLVTSEGPQIKVSDLPQAIVGHRPRGLPLPAGIMPLKQALEQVEMHLISEALRLYGSTTRVGEALGIHQSTAVRKIQKYQRRLRRTGHPAGT